MAGKGEPKLTEEARAFVVQSLAMFDAPSVVAKAVKQEFGIVVSPQALEFYDPTKRAGQKLAEKWRRLFHETRETFLDDSAQVATTHRLVRVRRLERMADKAESQGNHTLAASLLEQIAKEMGDAYTNTRKLQHGGEVAVKTLADFYGGAEPT